MPRTKIKTKTYAAQISASITVATLLEVIATTENEAQKKAEELFREYVDVDFRACDGNDNIAHELHFNYGFDVEDVQTEIQEQATKVYSIPIEGSITYCTFASVQISASITVYTFVEVTAVTEDEAQKKAEEQFRDYADIEFRACDGNDTAVPAVMRYNL